MSKSNSKHQSTPNRQKLEELEIREREVGLEHTKIFDEMEAREREVQLVHSKQECARRNIEILSRLDISTPKHEELKKEVLEAIRGNLSVLSAR